MESAHELKIDKRLPVLQQWLEQVLPSVQFLMQPMLGDASFRRYFRVFSEELSWVVMDAPPPREDCRPFVNIAALLRKQGLQAPEVIHANLEQGFLLLTDFGDATYLKALNTTNADQLYQLALQALSILQASPKQNIPGFTSDWMQQEWAWHKEWFLSKWLGLTLPAKTEQALDECFQFLVASAVSQPQVFMHRDYHSGNLMVLPEQVGILDFQDAFIGPVTYDLVSLLRDCYIDWPAQQVAAWALEYLHLLQKRGQLCDVNRQAFLRWFDLMGIERHLKALFTFARKQVRDEQPQYLQHIPRTLNYILEVSHYYPELAPLHQYYQTIVQPAIKEKCICVQ